MGLFSQHMSRLFTSQWRRAISIRLRVILIRHWRRVTQACILRRRTVSVRSSIDLICHGWWSCRRGWNVSIAAAITWCWHHARISLNSWKLLHVYRPQIMIRGSCGPMSTKIVLASRGSCCRRPARRSRNTKVKPIALLLSWRSSVL